MSWINRRSLVGLAVAIVLVAGLVPPLDAQAADARRLSFYHTHTGQSLDVVYYRNGQYVDAALEEINRFLMDFRTGDTVEIDPGLLNILYDIRNELGSDGVYEVISAYRSPKTNEMLRARSGGVAKKSQHLLGNAIDVRLRGVPVEVLRDTALRMKRGGVGFYRKSNFVHIDTGRVRRW